MNVFVALSVLGLSAFLGDAKAFTVTFSPDMSPQAIAGSISSSPDGTTFIFKPGVYRLAIITPRTGDIFVGQPGTVFNGSVEIQSFSRSGSLWTILNQVNHGQVSGQCDPMHPMCDHPEDLFFDDMPLTAVSTISEVKTGTWFFDYQHSVIYFADDPTRHKVEVSTTRNAFAGQVSNVTIEGFIIEKYAVPGQFGAIGDQYPGSGWVVKNNEIRLNHGVGIALGSHGSAIQNYIHHNGQLGIITGDTTYAPATSIVVADNEIAFNNWAGFETGWAAGGVKMCSAVNLIVQNNVVHDNAGPGLWTDIYSSNVTYSGNSVRNNAGMGIVHEISSSAKIVNNSVSSNYSPQNSWYWGAQILIQNSRDVEVYGNIVEIAPDKGDGIIIVQQNRGSGPRGPLESVNNYVHHNTVIHDGPWGRSGIAGDYNMAAALTTSGNRFDCNNYQATDSTYLHWVLDQPVTFNAFRFGKYELLGQTNAQLKPLLPKWPASCSVSK